MHILRISSLSDVISPDSLLMLIIICLCLCLLTFLGAFLASFVSCINSFLFLFAVVLRVGCFTDLLSSACSNMSFKVSLLFVAILYFPHLNFQFLYIQYS